MIFLLQSPTTPITVPQTGNTVRVPRVASIEYQDQVLKILVDGRVLRMFSDIVTLYFWTGFNRTRPFRGSAPFGTVFGGGTEMS